MENICATCLFWNRPSDSTDLGFGYCTEVMMVDGPVLPLFIEQTAVVEIDRAHDVDQAARLRTKATFGCVLWEEIDEPDCVE